MRTRVLAAMLAVLPFGLSGCSTGPGGEQTLVDRAALTVQEMTSQTVSDSPQSMLRKAKATMICPRVFKAGFFFGGEGGSCVLLARAGNGTWSYPAFYTIGSGSFGLQIGIQDSQVIIMIMTDKGLNAVMDNQIKLGADAGLAIATYGAGVQGSTTAAAGADIVAFAAARGLYGGISLEGSLMSTDTKANQGYYGQPYAARQIVVSMQGSNRGADPLRELLTRSGGRATEPVAAPMQPPPGYAPAYPPAYQPPAIPQQPQYSPQLTPAYPPTGRGPIQEQSLAPPGR
ncbi:MAG: lipid-binding SYLF domain-containing protein [Rhodospirillales bacterium]